MSDIVSNQWKTEEPYLEVTSHTSKGAIKICDIRGWGHLTGKGYGALGLSYDEAEAIQRSHAELIASAPLLKDQLTAANAKIAELEAQNAMMREALEKNRIEVFHLCKQADRKHRCPLELSEGSAVRVAYEATQQALTSTPADALERTRKKDAPDWFWCEIDPDESGDSPYDAMYQHRSRLTPTLLCSSYIGPNMWGVMYPLNPDDESGEEEARTFDTKEEAEAFCEGLRKTIEAARNADVEV